MFSASPAFRRSRGAAQLLGRPSGFGIAGVVERLLAVQAQDLRSARLALRARGLRGSWRPIWPSL